MYVCHVRIQYDYALLTAQTETNDCIIVYFLAFLHKISIEFPAVSSAQGPVYEEVDAMVNSPEATSPDPVTLHGPDVDTSNITIVPSWVSYNNISTTMLPQKCMLCSITSLPSPLLVWC